MSARSLLFDVMTGGSNAVSQMVQKVILLVNIPELACIFERVRKHGICGQSFKNGCNAGCAAGGTWADGPVKNSAAQHAAITGRIFAVPFAGGAGKGHFSNLSRLKFPGQFGIFYFQLPAFSGLNGCFGVSVLLDHFHPLNTGGNGGVICQLLMGKYCCRVLFIGGYRTCVVILGLGNKRLALGLILAIKQARIIVIHVRMRIQSAWNRRINAGLHLERPLVRVASLVAKFKPCWRAITSTRKTYKLDCSVVEIIMNPVGVAVEVLDQVERSS